MYMIERPELGRLDVRRGRVEQLVVRLAADELALGRVGEALGVRGVIPGVDHAQL